MQNKQFNILSTEKFVSKFKTFSLIALQWSQQTFQEIGNGFEWTMLEVYKLSHLDTDDTIINILVIKHRLTFELTFLVALETTSTTLHIALEVVFNRV